MSDGIDIVTEISRLPERPRGRACLVLSHDYADQRAWAATLADRADAGHIDLLDHFVESSELAAEISRFTVPNLFELLGRMNDRRVLVVSGLEFLLATWMGRPRALEEFAHRVEYWDRSPALALVVQHDRTLATRRFTRYPQYRFVIDQKETFALL